ncbi:uncharacterized protein LOC105193076 [Solenopsis invicta]|uniref:uncharacterized protein LOC105193076 n=1 Tax=Solenopsis invicta TaxID=13686 RepID=UPI000595F48B|nr:uncharacterized protein LOC105193076 [Solenopsis invicta]
MIKLFLFTLLCAAVFADSPIDEINQAWMKGQEIMDEAQKQAQRVEDFINQGHPLVRRMTQDMEPPKPPPGPPPSGQDSSLVRRAAQGPPDESPPEGNPSGPSK